MPQLEYITIKGFKSINTIEKLKLNPVNIVIGSNGSGKSNFIGIFSFLHSIREGRLQDYILKAGGANKVLHFGSKFTDTLYIKIAFENKINQYSIELQPTDNDELVPTNETTYFWKKPDYDRPYSSSLYQEGKEAGISQKNTSQTAEFVKDRLGNWRVYHFHDTSSSSPMKLTMDINENRFLKADGSNLASFLYYLQERHENSYRMIINSIRLVAPFFEDFVLSPQKLNPEKIKLEWRHKGSDNYFDASSFSDGTLRFIALTTLFLQPESYRPSVILVDEPELGLHPYAIEILASLIRQASNTTQVIITTQSPLLLDNFEPEDVLVANRVDGGTELTRLENNDSLNKWLDKYSLGQLWEKNELGGRPSSE